MNEASASRIPLVILGTSLFAPEVADLIDDTGRYDVTAFVENWDRDKTSEPFLGRPVVWIDDAGSLASTHQALCSLGTTRRKTFIEQVASLGFRFARVEHPDARISLKSEVGDGSIISVGVIVGAHTRVGRHVIVNRGTLIGHHVTVHDYVTISPGANIAGAVTVEEGAYVGMGAIVLDRLTIGANAVVGAGSVVTRNVPPGVQVMGVPAKITGEALQGR